MEKVSAEQLGRVIEIEHGGEPSFSHSVRVFRSNGDPALWDGVVHVFDLKENPNSRRAYAWACPIDGSNDPRYFAVLHQGRINTPATAVSAAVAAVRTWG